MLHQWGEIWHGGINLSMVKFTPILDYYHPTGAYPLPNFREICKVCNRFQEETVVKIWLNSLKGLRSYGGF